MRADGDVAQAGHDPRAVAAANLGPVLGAVADVVEPVFDLPMAAVQPEQTGGVRFVGAEARHPEAPLHSALSAANDTACEVGRDALNAEDLADVREVQVLV